MVVSNTTPLNYLVLIQAVEILPQLYGEIWIPAAVQAELTHPAAPPRVQKFAAAPPAWLHIGRVTDRERSLLLDDGEVEAILLAHELNARVLLIDERAGANAAQSRGLKVTGTLGILDEAARRNILDLRVALESLQQTTFRMPKRILKLLLEQTANRS
jgi:predicted nucleic acid-binding protein